MNQFDNPSGFAAEDLGEPTSAEVVGALHALAARVGADQRSLLSAIVMCDARRVWRDDDCRDVVQWVSLRLGISQWKAQRWVDAAYALERLPATSRALERGVLSLDKVVELTRLATPEDEAELVAWATGVAAGAIRERADQARRRSIEEARTAHRYRELRWWWEDEGDRLALWGSLPADQGVVVAKALDRLADEIPASPEDDPYGNGDTVDARRADALVSLASQSIADDQDPDRATMVVHADLAALASGDWNGRIAGGPALHPEVLRRLACDCRLQVVLHNPDGAVVGIGMTSRQVPAWLRRQVEHRDDYRCTFPGCGSKRFTDAHHVVPWPLGPTDLDNLALICRFHHRLVHEYGWHVGFGRDGSVRWFRPDWTPFEPRPAPGSQGVAPAA